MKKKNVYLQSIGRVEQNKFFTCLEYSELYQHIKYGIKICVGFDECKYFSLCDNKIFDYNNLKSLDDDIFNFYYINSNYSHLYQQVKNSKDSSFLLKKSYISLPICSNKEIAVPFQNKWYFKNIYNHYFCYCNGYNCPSNQYFDDCKYYLYLNIIDDSKELYLKTDYLLVDFLYANRAPGDAYFVFREMIRQNMSAYYLSERQDIYQTHFDNKTRFQRIIPIINRQYNITGVTLEKYLNLFLRLKSVISGSEFFSKENIFFNIQYITFICLGHGINYFKPFLYQDYYGCKRYNKIILPSNKIIKIAKLYGWEEKNVIKIGLPKWDLFDNYSLFMKNLTNEKCIFMMFTWRKLKEQKYISPNYFNNIFALLNNSNLTEIIHKNNITLYLSLHHNLLYKQNLFKDQTNIIYINQDEILNCLNKCSLVISDFSSVIFDLMHREKPFIIFIPDSDDKNIAELYDSDYFNIINGLTNDSIKFENKVFNINDVIKKIKYYVNNNFLLDMKLQKFYKEFALNNKNNIISIIEYLKSLT